MDMYQKRKVRAENKKNNNQENSSKVGLLTFTPSVTEWCEKTNAIGMYSKLGKYGGTYAHKDIAFEFASAISPVFKLYLIKEFERLKELEKKSINLCAIWVVAY